MTRENSDPPAIDADPVLKADAMALLGKLEQEKVRRSVALETSSPCQTVERYSGWKIAELAWQPLLTFCLQLRAAQTLN